MKADDPRIQALKNKLAGKEPAEQIVTGTPTLREVDPEVGRKFLDVLDESWKGVVNATTLPREAWAGGDPGIIHSGIIVDEGEQVCPLGSSVLDNLRKRLGLPEVMEEGTVVEYQTINRQTGERKTAQGYLAKCGCILSHKSMACPIHGRGDELHKPVDLGPPRFSFTQRAIEVGKRVAEQVEEMTVGEPSEYTYGGGSVSPPKEEAVLARPNASLKESPISPEAPYVKAPCIVNPAHGDWSYIGSDRLPIPITHVPPALEATHQNIEASRIPQKNDGKAPLERQLLERVKRLEERVFLLERIQAPVRS